LSLLSATEGGGGGCATQVAQTVAQAQRRAFHAPAAPQAPGKHNILLIYE